MESKNVFATDGVTFNLRSNMKAIWPLENGVYNLQYSEMSGIYLEKYADKFKFDFTRYAIDEEFIQHALLRYKSITKNMGILLNGKKGAGKSVIAKTIANEVDRPVIIISGNYPGLIDFMSKITFPCVFFLDEFEKNFMGERGGDQNLLSVMDGVYTGDVPHLFLLTTNSLTINENFLSRPGRILYCRTYDSLPSNIVRSFVQDNLKDSSLIDDVLIGLESLEFVTIDILRSICEEINTTGISPKKALEYLNIKKVSKRVSTSYHNSGRRSNEDYNFEKFEKDLEIYDFIENHRDNWSSVIEKYGEDFERPNIDFSMVYIDGNVEDLEVGDYFEGDIITKIKDKKYIKTENDYGDTYWYRIDKVGQVGKVNKFVS